MYLEKGKKLESGELGLSEVGVELEGVSRLQLTNGGGYWVRWM